MEELGFINTNGVLRKKMSFIKRLLIKFYRHSCLEWEYNFRRGASIRRRSTHAWGELREGVTDCFQSIYREFLHSEQTWRQMHALSSGNTFPNPGFHPQRSTVECLPCFCLLHLDICKFYSRHISTSSSISRKIESHCLLKSFYQFIFKAV